jgi:hypothetical protein
VWRVGVVVVVGGVETIIHCCLVRGKSEPVERVLVDGLGLGSWLEQLA